MDLTDNQWNSVKDLLPCARLAGAGRPKTSPRAILDAILWVEETGERWIYLPPHYPPRPTCYNKYLQWRKSGLLARVMAVLEPARGRALESPQNEIPSALATPAA